MQQTSNYALKKPEQTDVVNIEDLNTNFDTIDTELKKVSDKANLIQTAGGTGTAITLNNVSLVNGFTVTFVVAANNSGAATTINGKALYKPGGTSAPTLTAGKAVTVWYNGTNFFIKASAEGNSVAADVLAGKTFSNDADTGLTGTMTNNGAVSQSLAINGTYNITAGYHNGSGKVTQSITTKAAATYNPSTSAQTIAAGQYLSGAQTIAATTGTSAAGDVLSGKTFNSANGIGLTGTMHNNGSVGTQTLATEGAEYTIPAGYHNGLGKVKAAITGLIASVIKAGTTVGGILGTFTADATATAAQMLSGATAYVNGNKVTGNIPVRPTNTPPVEVSYWTPGLAGNTYAKAHMRAPAGYYDGYVWLSVDQPDLLSANILSGKNIFGVAGAIVDRSTENWHQPALGATASIADGYGAYVIPPAGYYNGQSWVRSLQPDMVSANIVSGKNIFGVVGTAKRVVKGVTTVNIVDKPGVSHNGVTGDFWRVIVSGLGFTPDVITVYGIRGDGQAWMTIYISALNTWLMHGWQINGSSQWNLFSGGYDIIADSNFYVNSTGFTAPTKSGANQIYWTAME